VSIIYRDTKINIIDTPGHSDFGGEVERVLNMADGVILLVDAFEGPMPQTRFVLQKAIQIGLKPIVVINKVDKPNCRPDEVQEEVFDLMFSLDATEEQLDFPTVYGSAKNNWMSDDWKKPRENDITPILDAIIEHIPEPEYRKGTPQMLVTSLDFSSYVGRIAIGRIHRGELRENQDVALVKRDGSMIKSRIKELHVFEGFGRAKVQEAGCGEICALVGIEGFEIGDSICDIENPEPLDPIAIDEPTMSMVFSINDSPFFGQDGKYVTSRHINDRLIKELDRNLALRVQKSPDADIWSVFGRGVLHLSVLIETMRREGYELQVGQPQVIFKEIDGVKCEPIEQLSINLPEEGSGKVIEMVAVRKGEMVSMERKGERVHLEFQIPSRGIIGLRTNVLTATAGEAVMAHRFLEYQPYKGDIEKRANGSIIAMESGTAYAYAIDKLQDRGKFFIYPQDEVYAGQVVGEHAKEGDLVVNVTKSKKLTNMRASGADDKAKIIPPIVFSLEEALEYIKEDEYVEITPNNMRLRKIILDETERKRASKK
jgi:GTP-binding protein